MQKIRDIGFDYELTDICNMVESGLFYRIGPRQTYLTARENYRVTRGTELQNKSDMSVSF